MYQEEVMSALRDSKWDASVHARVSLRKMPIKLRPSVPDAILAHRAGPTWRAPGCPLRNWMPSRHPGLREAAVGGAKFDAFAFCVAARKVGAARGKSRTAPPSKAAGRAALSRGA
jgi:hypothetical protein